MNAAIETKITEGLDAVKAFRAHADKQFKELGAITGEHGDRLKAVEQIVAGGARGPAIGGSHSKGLGASVIESEGYRAFIEGKTARGKVPLSGLSLELKGEVKNIITGDSGSPATPDGVLVQPQRMQGIVHAPERALRIRDLLPVMRTNSSSIEYTRELAFTNNAAEQAGEGATKAQSDITFEDVRANVVTIAHWLKVSRQALSDSPSLQVHLDHRMRYGVLLREDNQLLNGDGTGNNMAGLLNAGNFTAYAYGSTGDTMTDTLRKAIEQLQVADYQATGIVLNPRDWSSIERQKDTQDRYLFANPQQASIPQLWGLPVVASNSIAQGTFAVADFLSAAILWDREQAVVEFFEEDEDNIQRNLVTVRAEERLALTVLLPGAIVSGSF